MAASLPPSAGGGGEARPPRQKFRRRLRFQASPPLPPPPHQSRIISASEEEESEDGEYKDIDPSPPPPPPPTQTHTHKPHTPSSSSSPSSSLFQRKDTIPTFIRYGLPFLFLCNTALLLYSNFTLGATVHAKLYDGGQGRTLDLPVLYEVSLGNAIGDMWKGKAYVMSSLIAVFSGAWPHVKVVVSLLCWFLPERYLGAQTRHTLLVATYVLQKFSHVETFTLVILMTAFSFTARLPEHEDWGVWTYVHPQLGFFAFLGGLILSMLLSRVALHYNYVASLKSSSFVGESLVVVDEEEVEVEEEGEERDEEEGQRSSVDTYDAPDLSRPLLLPLQGKNEPRDNNNTHILNDDQINNNDTTIEPSTWRAVLTAYLILGLGILYIVGIVMPSFSFHFQGLAGWLLDNVTESSPDSSSSTRISSVLSLGQGIPSASDTPNGLGVRFLQAAFFFFVIGAPLGCIVLLLLLLLLPHTYTDKLKLRTATEVLYAWSAPDVLCMSMIACTLEMYLFVRFVIGSRCDGINVILKDFFDQELAGDDKCFDVVTSLKPGCFVLGAACVLFFVGGYGVIRQVEREMKREGVYVGGYVGGGENGGSGGRRREEKVEEEEEEGAERSESGEEEMLGFQRMVSLAVVPDEGGGEEERVGDGQGQLQEEEAAAAGAVSWWWWPRWWGARGTENGEGQEEGGANPLLQPAPPGRTTPEPWQNLLPGSGTRLESTSAQ